MVCDSCGFNNPPNAQSCDKCGALQEPSQLGERLGIEAKSLCDSLIEQSVSGYNIQNELMADRMTEPRKSQFRATTAKYNQEVEPHDRIRMGLENDIDYVLVLMFSSNGL